MRKAVFLLLLLGATVALLGCAAVRDKNNLEPWPPPERSERNIGIGLIGGEWHGPIPP